MTDAATWDRSIRIERLRETVEVLTETFSRGLEPGAGADVLYYRCYVEGIDGEVISRSIHVDGVTLYLIEDSRGDAWAVLHSIPSASLVYRRLQIGDCGEDLVGTILPLLAQQKLLAPGWCAISARLHS